MKTMLLALCLLLYPSLAFAGEVTVPGFYEVFAPPHIVRDPYSNWSSFTDTNPQMDIYGPRYDYNPYWKDNPYIVNPYEPKWDD